MRVGARGCDEGTPPGDGPTPHNPLLHENVCDSVRGDAAVDENPTDTTNKCDLRFTRPLPDSVSASKQEGCEGSKSSARYNTSTRNEQSPSDDSLDQVIGAWPSLPTAIRAGIMAMIQSMEEEG